MGKLTQFKYEQLDELTADFLRQKESNMREIVGKAYTELGRELTEARDRLAGSNQYDGLFDKWCASLDFSKRTVTNLIQRYEMVTQKLPDRAELLEDLPVSLTYDIAKPSAESTSAKAQAKAEVLAGDIDTLKEYRERIKELESRAEKAKQQAEAERKERERLEIENEELANREPEVVTEYVEKETQEPYDRTLDEPYLVERSRDFYEMLNEVDGLYRKYAHLSNSIEELRDLAYYDDDAKQKYWKADEFWRNLREIFKEGNSNIIDAEII